ncbi:penicillin acylase family protein [Georgenia faecalis]|uniref:penicillin acylase family protein n=1 Tax=Georgenia faecalis TaxID=2483799 RepID=UPI000FDB2F33|nr:penicillin acylase family protein [Georgenia faecalis]
MSVVKRVSIIVSAMLVVVLVVGVSLALALVRRPLPEYGGTQELAILDGEVEVLRDELGVPQIYADTDLDLFRAQGYVHAQDRFFEMDYRRHVTAGRLAELVGENEDAIAADSVIRTLGWRRVAEQEWDLLAEDTRTYLEAYAEGVNAYLDANEASELGVEYTVLGLSTTLTEVEPWDPIDSLAWLKAMAWDLAANYDEELGRAAALPALAGDVARVEQLYPGYPYDRNAPILSAYTPTAPAAQEAADTTVLPDGEWLGAVEAALDAVGAVPHLLGEGDGIGSNSFVVAGEHTSTGEPLLANDPHLGISMPGVWHQAGLHCRAMDEACTFDVAGFGFAGLPGVIMGHNTELAWGLTNLGADVVDFFLERVYDDGTYLRDGERVPLERRTETIRVNDAEDIALGVASTVHGPIVSGVLPETAAAGNTPVPAGSPPSGFGGYAVAMSWTALTPGRTADAIFAINRADDADAIAAAAALFDVPAQNIVFATAAGDIGYQAPGRIPVRQSVADTPVPSDGSWPRPGWNSAFDWVGYVAPENMPRGLNPEEGFIVAANQAVLPAGVGPFLTADYDAGYRSQRIRELLTGAIEQGQPLDAQTVTTMMSDNASPFAEAIVPVLLEVPVEDPFVEEAVALLEDWAADGYPQDGDSPAAAYFAAVWAHLLTHTFADELPASVVPEGGSRSLDVVRSILETPSNPWWDDRTTVSLVESRDEILAQSLTNARYELTNSLGADPSQWRWDRLHRVAPTHPVLGGEGIPEPVRRLVNPTPVGVGGGASIVNATGWDASATVGDRPDYRATSGPSMRMVVDLSDLDASVWVNATGNSGHPASVHYTDQIGAWARGETFAWPYSRAAVEQAAQTTQTLVPGD